MKSENFPIFEDFINFCRNFGDFPILGSVNYWSTLPNSIVDLSNWPKKLSANKPNGLTDLNNISWINYLLYNVLKNKNLSNKLILIVLSLNLI